MEKNLSRNQTHDAAMTLIYNALTYEIIEEPIDIQQLLVNFFQTPYEEIDVYIREVVIKALKNKETIISLIEPNLKNWRFDRLNLLTQSIFLLAVSHFVYVKEVDKKIVIDNAVKLAKKYVDVKDYAFVNAILDKVL
jgi:transcription antitermination factor NusB